ncbi:unnamed protein product [Effrenium voratum]|nr:unnamed protein product [Effrenium voratum]
MEVARQSDARPASKSPGDWDWVFKKANKMSASDLAPPRAQDMGRTLSSPCMLTEEGIKESVRVLGSCHNLGTPLVTAGRQAAEQQPFVRLSSAGDRRAAAALRDFVPPTTCNQIYGSRWKTAERPVDKWGKQSCDFCLFVDHMHKTKRPYCPHLRL